MTEPRRPGDKGYQLEELLRAYFLRAGFFAVRGVPFQDTGSDLTDIDIWLYERPTGSSRRRQIVDAKSKNKPKAVERLLWTRGLVELLDVDGGYVATTDSRITIRRVAKKLGLSVLDGTDVARISTSDKVLYSDRITEEDLVAQLVVVDKARKDKTLQLQYHDIKHSLIEGFGAGTLNRALDSFSLFANGAVTSHPGSEAAEAYVRLAYFASSIVAIAIDYIYSDLSFRAAEERRSSLINAIRFGSVDVTAGLERVRLATALLNKYAPNGEAISRSVETAIQQDYNRIPAEIIADYVSKLSRGDELFQTARKLEHFCFLDELMGFDKIEPAEKSFVAVLLDYAGINRAKFAASWEGSSATKGVSEVNRQVANDGPLFKSVK